MRRFPPPDPPPERRPRRDLQRPEGPFDRLLRRRPERDPAPIIIGGTIGFLALVIILVFVFSSVFGGGGGSSTNPGSGGDTSEVGSGVRARLADTPALPPGLVVLSQYVELTAADDAPATIALPLKEQVSDPAGLGFYTYFEGRWQRLADAKLRAGNKVAEGAFPSVPKNVAVLRVVSQTYQATASLPAGAGLHADARVSIISPRDYSPGADGSVQGKATTVNNANGSILVMPTIVGSGPDTAKMVNEIMNSDSLRNKHVRDIVTLVQNAKLDGIDLEYSSVSADTKEQFAAFVQSLADGLHKQSKRLSLTLPPPTDQRSAYDFKELGQQVDLIKILPIADPISYWETMPGALGRATQDVDPKKIMLVMSPFSIASQNDVSQPVGYQQAMLLATQVAVREPQNPNDIKPGGTVRLVATNLDEGEGASPMKWDNDAATVTFSTGGTDHKRIYIENGFSFRFKLELVQAYGLAGVSVSDGSATSDLSNVWTSVNELMAAATLSLARPNDASLQLVWQAPDGGDVGAGAGTTATWIPPAIGDFNIILITSDGERRFAQKTVVHVQTGTGPSPSPVASFPPDTATPSPTSASPTPTGSGAAAGVLVEVGKLADGDDADGTFSNDEVVSPGSSVKYLITIDNDAAAEVSVVSLLDSFYGDVTCSTSDGANAVGLKLAADDGDGPGLLDSGPDEVQCTFSQTAPTTSGETVQDVVTVVVEDAGGNVDSDQDVAKVTTS